MEFQTLKEWMFGQRKRWIEGLQTLGGVYYFNYYVYQVTPYDLYSTPF